MHTHLMVSVWPKFYPGTKNFKELASKGYIYMHNIKVGQKAWLGHLGLFYDPYVKQARRIYWRQSNDALGKLGVDAWWLDSDKPDIEANLSIAKREQRRGPARNFCFVPVDDDDRRVSRQP